MRTNHVCQYALLFKARDEKLWKPQPVDCPEQLVSLPGLNPRSPLLASYIWRQYVVWFSVAVSGVVAFEIFSFSCSPSVLRPLGFPRCYSVVQGGNQNQGAFMQDWRIYELNWSGLIEMGFRIEQPTRILWYPYLVILRCWNNNQYNANIAQFIFCSIRTMYWVM